MEGKGEKPRDRLVKTVDPGGCFIDGIRGGVSIVVFGRIGIIVGVVLFPVVVVVNHTVEGPYVFVPPMIGRVVRWPLP